MADKARHQGAKEERNNDQTVNDHPILKAEDLDVVGRLFGLRFAPGCSNRCVELYIEDDENWFYKCTFDSSWLIDLANVATRGSCL